VDGSGRTRIAILLGTFNGQPYLAEQLDSIAGQTLTDWHVWASDDGSNDQTINILQSYQSAWGGERLSIREGLGRGFAANFLSLVCDPSIDADYYAFSDQDDIWDPKKLEMAILRLQQAPSSVPTLYCGRTLLIDEKNNEIGYSTLFIKPPCFANSLLQNLAGGNTMVFNKAARELMLAIGSDLKVVSHDWWAYMLITGCGGNVIYDQDSYIRYRQHKYNLIGANKNTGSWRERFLKIFKGRYRYWLNVNLAALEVVKSKLTLRNKRILADFCKARQMPIGIRAFAILLTKVHRQTLLGNIGIFLAALINRV
jgi:glycosyltransferase involved in cell wall biosynthesis